jgi:hypothetical protein
VLSLISTLYKSLYSLSFFPACCLSNSRSLAQASTRAESSATCAHVDTARRISGNWTQYSAGLGSSLYSLGAEPTENIAFYCCMGLVSAGTCLPSRCSETVVSLFAYCIATAVLGCLFRGLYLGTDLYATINSPFLLIASWWLFNCFIIRPWRWKQFLPPRNL